MKESSKSCTNCRRVATCFVTDRYEYCIGKDYRFWESKTSDCPRTGGGCTMPGLDCSDCTVELVDTEPRPEKIYFDELRGGSEPCSAATPEPMSRPGYREVFPEIVKDLEARSSLGTDKYGFPLSSHNGRNALNDAYQEALDQAQYLKQALMEQESTLEDSVTAWARNVGLLDVITPESQLGRLRDEGDEWIAEVLKGDSDAEDLELGDMLITLINLAASRGKSLTQCGWQSLKKIEHRKGHISGTDYIKDED